MSKNLYPAEELEAFLFGDLMTRWHQIALQCGFRDSGPPPEQEILQPFLNRAEIADVEELQTLLQGLGEAKGRYFLRKIRALVSGANFEAAPAYLVQHFLYLLLPEDKDLLKQDELGPHLIEALPMAKHATLSRESEDESFAFETLRFEKFCLRNYRGFENYTISALGSRLTVLIGDNGSGKTALLDGITALIANHLHSHPSSAELISQIHFLQHDRDLHQKIYFLGQTPTREPADRIELFSDGFANDTSVNWRMETNPSGTNILPVGTAFWFWHEQVAKGIPVCLPVVAYYGSGRLTQHVGRKSAFSGPNGLSSRLKGYNNCLEPSSDLKGFLQWFRQNELAALQKGETRHVLECVRQSIISMVPEAQGARWDMDFDELHLLFDEGDRQISKPFYQLSDGYRNLVGIAGDLAWRMAQLNPQLETEAVNLTAGIVLIDEIDLHLHPNWQRIVVPRLLETFPQVQFIVTTHSPFIIQSIYDLPERAQVVLWDVDAEQALGLESKSIEDIAEEQQHVPIPQQSRRFLEMEEAAAEFYQLLETEPENEEEKARLKERLDALMFPFSDDPAFQASLRVMRRDHEACSDETD